MPGGGKRDARFPGALAAMTPAHRLLRPRITTHGVIAFATHSFTIPNREDAIVQITATLRLSLKLAS